MSHKNEGVEDISVNSFLENEDEHFVCHVPPRVNNNRNLNN